MREFPDPWGMSGGAVFRLADLTALNTSSFTPKLVGIAMEYHTNPKVLVSVNIAFVIEALRSKFPNPDSLLPRSHTLKINTTLV